jgi:UDP-glucose 4-epimerase
MAKVLVTGGAGNIGSFIVEQLIALGHSVVIVDNFYNSKIDNVSKPLRSGKAMLEVCDISDYRRISAVFEKHKPEYVSHQASMMIMDSQKFPFDALDINVKGTFHVIQCCIDHSIKRITFASSASIFGEPLYIPVDEKHPLNNHTFYGATKIADEALFDSWAYTHNIPYVGFRYYNCYSERQGIGAFYTQVFQKWIHLIKAGKPIEIYGDGSQTMDLIHAEDAARANIMALFNDHVKFEYFNVGTGIETSLIQLKDMLFKKMGRSVEVRYIPYDEHLVTRRASSTKKIKEMLDFEPTVSIEKGIERYVNALR